MNRLNESKSSIFVSLIFSLIPEDLRSELICSRSQLCIRLDAFYARLDRIFE